MSMTWYPILIWGLLVYGVLTTTLIVRWHWKWTRTEKLIDRLNEQVIMHRRLVNELQSIGEDEASAIIEMEGKQKPASVLKAFAWN